MRRCGRLTLCNTAVSQELTDGSRSKAHDFKEVRGGGTMQVGVRKRNALSEWEATAVRLPGAMSAHSTASRQCCG